MTTNNYPAIRETLYSETLPNGLTILVAKKPGYRKTFALFATDYGGADRRYTDGGACTDSPAGVAHFLEHKLFDMPDGGNALATNGKLHDQALAFLGSLPAEERNVFLPPDNEPEGGSVHDLASRRRPKPGE